MKSPGTRRRMWQWGISLVVGCVGALLLGSCGSGADNFECGSSASCAAGSEYCLVAYVDGAESSATCVALPDGCADCSCAQADAPARLGAGESCATMTMCVSINDAITVECQ